MAKKSLIDAFSFGLDDTEIKKERHKARELRKTQWWKRCCAKGKCYYCGRSFPAKELTMDHVVPLSRGGKTTKNNVVTCCKECNNHKKHLLPMEWEEYLKNIRVAPE